MDSVLGNSFHAVQGLIHTSVFKTHISYGGFFYIEKILPLHLYGFIHISVFIHAIFFSHVDAIFFNT